MIKSIFFSLLIIFGVSSEVLAQVYPSPHFNSIILDVPLAPQYGGGISQLTGPITAGPGIGSQLATITPTGVVPGIYNCPLITFNLAGQALSAVNGTCITQTTVLGGALIGTLPNPSLAVGAAAANVGSLGGALQGFLPNPTLAPGVAAPNIGPLGGVLSGTLPNPQLIVGAAATNVGSLGGVLTGTLPNPGMASGVAATNIGTLSEALVGTLPSPSLASGVASANIGTLGGVLSGTLPNPQLVAGAAAGNIGNLGGVLTGNLPNPGLASGVATTNIGTLGGVLTGTLPNPGMAPGTAIANIGYTPLNPAFNLSDVQSTSTARQFLGLGPWTTGFFYKGTGTTAPVISALSDNGTFITSTEGLNATTNPFVNEGGNDSTGTTVGLLAGITATGTVSTVGSVSDGSIGVIVGGAGISGTVQIAQAGRANCTFDNAVVAGHFVVIGSNGRCHDSGSATRPTGVQTIGIAWANNASPGVVPIDISLGFAGSGGGGGPFMTNCLAMGTSSTDCLATGTGSNDVLGAS